MPLGGLPELRRLLAAERLCDRAPCMKMTAGRRLQRARHIAAQPDALALHPWIGNQDRRQQRFGVGMFRRRVELARRLICSTTARSWAMQSCESGSAWFAPVKADSGPT